MDEIDLNVGCVSTSPRFSLFQLIKVYFLFFYQSSIKSALMLLKGWSRVGIGAMDMSIFTASIVNRTYQNVVIGSNLTINIISFSIGDTYRLFKLYFMNNQLHYADVFSSIAFIPWSHKSRIVAVW